MHACFYVAHVCRNKDKTSPQKDTEAQTSLCVQVLYRYLNVHEKCTKMGVGVRKREGGEREREREREREIWRQGKRQGERKMEREKTEKNFSPPIPATQSHRSTCSGWWRGRHRPWR